MPNIVFFVLVFLLPFVASSQFSNLSVILTKGNESEKLLLSSLETTLLTHKFYDPSLKNVIYFFGYISSYEHDPSVKSVQQAFDTLGGYNFMVADWSSYNTGNYIDVGNKLTTIADEYGEKFAEMVTADKITLANWHFVGMSLGAHLAGGTARKIRSTSNDKKLIVPRITGLDPAGPLIYPTSSELNNYIGLTSTDGKNLRINFE